MSLPSALPHQALPVAVLVATAACAQGALGQAQSEGETADPFAPLAVETRPLATRWQSDYAGQVQLGLGYTSDDNFMFGQYSGLENDGANLVGSLNWQDYRSGDSYWQVELSDLGLSTREGEVSWGVVGKLRISAGFDSQQQVRNDSGATPFSGSGNLTLPDTWTSANYSSSFTTLEEALHGFQRELSRDRLSLSAEGTLSDKWRFNSSLSYEEKEGDGDIGGAIYTSLTVGDAVLMPLPIDQSATELDLGLSFQGDKLHLQGQLAYSDFDNEEDLLSWQNPYSSFGSRVRYPSGYGGLAQAPDNEQVSGRLTGHYLFSGATRLQFDGSYAIASQDASFDDYTVNPSLAVYQDVPRSDLDGEVASAMVNTKLMFRPLDRVNAEVFYKLRDRDYDVDRDGYLYVRGDATDQPDSALTVYNSAHGLTEQTLGFEADYRLPGRWRKFGRLSFGYDYEEVERENAAVEETAHVLGIPAQAGVSPQAKLAALEARKSEGAKPLMVGDGLNDGPALAAAHASIAPGTASDASQQAADAVFIGERLMPVALAVRVARSTMRIVRQNFAFAIGYNLLAVPLALFGFVTPLIAAIAMSASSLVVIANSLRLARSAR